MRILIMLTALTVTVLALPNVASAKSRSISYERAKAICGDQFRAQGGMTYGCNVCKGAGTKNCTTVTCVGGKGWTCEASK